MLRLLCSACLLALTVQAVARSAYISELFVDAGDARQPDAVEITAASSSTTLELLVLDATESSPGSGQSDSTILQIIRFTPVANDALLIHEGTWDAALYGSGTSPNIAALGDAGISGASTWNLAQARSLVLLSETTMLNTGTRYNDVPGFFLGSATTLDVMTLSFNATGYSLHGEPVHDINAGQVLSVAPDVETLNPTHVLIGTADSHGEMPNDQGYFVSPGDTNMAWSPAAVPEPSTLMILAATAVVLLRRRET